jgi:hypothetical protein
MTIALRSPGRGSRRDFDRATVTIDWREDDDHLSPGTDLL